MQHAKAARWRFEESYECLREDVLAGVLLHVIEAPGPIDSSLDPGTYIRRASLDDMQYAVVLVVYALKDSFTVERSRVARLTATGWIKRGAIECHGSPTANAIGLVGNERFKLD
jgi:hypothetical protein